MSNTIISQINLNEDEELVVSTKKKKAIKPNFYMIGNGTMNKYRIKSIDLVQAVTEMTKVEQRVIILIKDLVTFDNTDGVVYVKFSKDEKQQQKKFLEGYKLLEKKELVRRVKPSHYMVNPSALIPTDYEAAKLLWNSLDE